MLFFANIFVHTLLTDLLGPYIHRVNNCIPIGNFCDESPFQTLVMCTLHNFLCSKVRFIDTSTVTGSHSCSGKNYA